MEKNKVEKALHSVLVFCNVGMAKYDAEVKRHVFLCPDATRYWASASWKVFPAAQFDWPTWPMIPQADDKFTMKFSTGKARWRFQVS
jgi:hypothetical protein